MKNELSPQAKSRQPPAPIPRRLLGRLALPLKILVLSSSHSGTVSIHCTPACLRRLPSPRATCFMTTKQSQKLSGRFFTQGEFGLASKTQSPNLAKPDLVNEPRELLSAPADRTSPRILKWLIPKLLF
jgi:hypothetical protein